MQSRHWLLVGHQRRLEAPNIPDRQAPASMTAGVRVKQHRRVIALSATRMVIKAATRKTEGESCKTDLHCFVSVVVVVAKLVQLTPRRRGKLEGDSHELIVGYLCLYAVLEV